MWQGGCPPPPPPPALSSVPLSLSPPTRPPASSSSRPPHRTRRPEQRHPPPPAQQRERAKKRTKQTNKRASSGSGTGAPRPLLQSLFFLARAVERGHAPRSAPAPARPHMRPSTSLPARQGVTCHSSLTLARSPPPGWRRAGAATAAAATAFAARSACPPAALARHHRADPARRLGRRSLQTVAVFTGKIVERSRDVERERERGRREGRGARVPIPRGLALSSIHPSIHASTPPGIVQGKAAIAAVDRRAAGAATLRIAFPAGALAGVAIGASVAINGTCLTVCGGGGWDGEGESGEVRRGGSHEPRRGGRCQEREGRPPDPPNQRRTWPWADAGRRSAGVSPTSLPSHTRSFFHPLSPRLASPLPSSSLLGRHHCGRHRHL